MKNLKYIYLVVLLLMLSACDEEKILEEVPLDFTTVENSFNSPDNIKASVAQLYNLARLYFGDNDSGGSDFDMWWGTDAGWHARNPNTHVYSQYSGFGPDNIDVQERWERAYKIVNNANVVLGRIDAIEFSDNAEKQLLLTEARFFRAWAYRTLVYLYGDVPLILEEVTSPRRDYVRAPKADVVAAIIEDLEFAKANLLEVDQLTEDGRISKDVARHFLAEMYIVSGQNQLAIDNANEVINGGKYTLMTSRFGSRASEPGDVYWDLFRLDNQNRNSGNTESIWVYQVEYETLGGYGAATGNANYYERIIGPEYNRFTAKDENIGVRTYMYESDYHGGRGQGYFRPSSYATHTMWTKQDPTDFDADIRNSDYNILRKWWVDNPLSKYYNEIIDLRTDSKAAYEKYIETSLMENDTNRKVYPVFLKWVQINNHFDTDFDVGSANLLSAAQEPLATQTHKDLIASYGGVGPKLSFNGRRLFTDQYAVRLPETLLLRAEAHMNNNAPGLAADDINTIRMRANASLIAPGDVTIDLILDERLRELYLEEPRRLTLNRLGLLYERTKNLNYYSGPNVQPHNNLYPIPSIEIQNNTEAELTQNTGY